MTPDTHLLDLVRKIEAFGRSNDSRETERARRMLNLERDTAELIHILVRSSRRKRILEIGTSKRDREKVEQARLNIASAGLSDQIEILEGSATELVKTLPGPFDCVFFDADRISAPEQLRLLLPKLENDALLLADNILSHPEEVAGYLKEFDHLSEFVTTTATVGKGLHIAYRS